MGPLLSLFGGDNAVLTVIVALAAVLLLIILGVWALKLVFNATGRAARGRAKRLGVVDVAPVDQKRQLVLVRRDNVEHLLLIGGLQDLVIESGIEADPAAAATRFGRQVPAAQNQPAAAGTPTSARPVPVAPAPSAAAARRTRESNLPPDLTAMRSPRATSRGSLRNTGFMRDEEKREPDFIPSVSSDWSVAPDDSDKPVSMVPVPEDLIPGPSDAEKGDEPDLERNGNDSRSDEKNQNN